MKRSLFCFILLCILSIGCQTGHDRCVPGMAAGVLDPSDTLSLGLQKCEQAEWIEVFRSDGYVNNVVLTAFKGRFYCMWQQSERDEDTPDTRVMLSVSEDGKNWSAPSVLVPPTQEYFASPGGWIRNGDTLTALVNYTFAPDRSQGGKAFFISTVDGQSWTELQPVLMDDGTPVEGIFEQDPLKLPDGRIVGAVHFQALTNQQPHHIGRQRDALVLGIGLHHALEESIFPGRRRTSYRAQPVHCPRRHAGNVHARPEFLICQTLFGFKGQRRELERPAEN